MKRLIAILALAIGVLAVSVAPAFAGQGGTDRPYKSSGSLVGTINLDFNSPDFLTFNVSGPSIQSHLGKGTTEVAGSLLSGVFTTTITAANGDELIGAFAGDLPATGTCPAGFTATHTLQTFTGGTGRFTNPTGTVDVTGCASISPTGALVINFTGAGTISY